jgi:hypothetical protein
LVRTRNPALSRPGAGRRAAMHFEAVVTKAEGMSR